MTATISGNFKRILRVPTGFYSLDRACLDDEGHIGLPIGTGYEIFGVSGIGKSTFTYSLSAILGEFLDTNIVAAALEDFDSRLLQKVLDFAGFTGNLHVTDRKGDEDNLYEVVNFLHKKDYAIGIVDSLGAISPISEQQGDIGEANMGRRAIAVAQFTRKCMPLLRDDESTKTIFMLNHWYPKIGTRGYDSPGGEVKKFITTVRILLRRIEDFPDGSYSLQGEIKKNRWGFNGRKFNAFMLVGRGLHRGLSTMLDCIDMKKAERKSVVKVGGESLGRLAGLVKAAKEGDEKVFDPFYAALEGAVEETKGEETEENHEPLLEGE